MCASENNLKKVNLDLSEEHIRVMDVDQYKTLIKTAVRKEPFKEFKNMQANHEKGKDIHHDNLKAPQSYMTTKLNNKEVSLLFNLRCQSVSGVKDNFHTLSKTPHM